MELMISGAALAFAINILTSVVKNFILPKFGEIGIHVFAFALATIGALYFLYSDMIPGFSQAVQAAIAVFTTAVAFYEVVLKHLSSFFKKGLA
jgi:hypothetical protein